MINERLATETPRPDGTTAPLVFVTVGTDVHPFARVIDWVDRWLAGSGAGARVVVQYGNSPAPTLARGEVALPYAEMRRYLADAAAVVCHGGPGTIMEARRLGIEPIVVPRRHDLGEHVDNHQMHFARKLAANDGLQLAEDYETFVALLDAGVRDPDRMRIPARPALGPGVTEFGKALADLGPRRRWTARLVAGRKPRARGAPSSPADVPARPPVLFIAGWGRSGSTLVDRTIGSVHGVASVGELRDLWTRGVVENRLCGCGEPFLSCPFWREVGERAFGGWDRLDLDRLRALRARVDRPWTIPLLIWPVLPSFRRDRNEYAATLDTLLDAVGTVSSADLLVESTKISTFALLLRITGRQVRMLHLVRDSRGVMHSWHKLVERSDSSGTPAAAVPGVPAGETMMRYGSLSGSLRYVIYNGLAQLVAALPPTRMPYLRLRYEDFVASPAAARAAIIRFAGVRVADEVSGGTGEVRLGTCHSVDGNPHRTSSGSVRVRLDDEWRRAMPRRSRAVVTVLTAPLLSRYGYLGRRGRAPRGTLISISAPAERSPAEPVARESA